MSAEQIACRTSAAYHAHEVGMHDNMTTTRILTKSHISHNISLRRQ